MSCLHWEAILIHPFWYTIFVSIALYQHKDMQNNNNKKTICCLPYLSRIRSQLSDPHSPCHEIWDADPSAGGWPWAAGSGHQSTQLCSRVHWHSPERRGLFQWGWEKEHDSRGSTTIQLFANCRKRMTLEVYLCQVVFQGNQGKTR